MRSPCRSFMLLILTLWLSIAAPTSFAIAEEDPTVGVISLGSYEQIMQHANVLGAIVGFPNLDKMIELQLLQATGGQALQAIDKTKPIMLDVRLGKKEPYAVVCLPVTGLKELLGTLPNPLGQTDDVGDGVLLLKNTPEPMYVKEEKGWSFWAQQKEYLADLPKDPEKLVGDLPEKYLVGARAFMQKIPPEKRAEAIGFLELMAQMSLAGGGGAEFGLEEQLAATKQQIGMLRQWIDDTKEVTLGVGFDKETQSVHLDFVMTAMSGSEALKSYKRFKKGKSDHAGFLHEDATLAIAVNMEGQPIKEEIALLDAQEKMFQSQMAENIDTDSSLDDEEKDKIKQSADKMIGVLFDTLRSKQFQAGMAAFINDRSTFVFGGQVTDGNVLEGAVKQLIEIAGKKLDFPQPNWEEENHGFYRIHTWKTPVPDDDAKKMFGEQLEFALGFNKSSIYFAFGGNGIADLKKTLDAATASSKKPIDPLQAFVKLGPLLAAAATQEGGQNLAPIVGMLHDKDQILYTIQPIEGGIHGRIVLQQNLLRAIPLMSMIMGSGPAGVGGGPGNNPFGE